ncbi:MAG: putative hydrolase or acyltransferase of alpha/beta superfamily [Ilumatobacteraceae bacterium]|nr:putative hydrolase or acyltransferase of alpha/beta superfamily [Ilumatobacteraceae bacterium]
MQYDSSLRPPQDTPAFDAFQPRREVVRDGISLSFLHEGVGGYPLLLLHGYPETNRIWWRNIAPLAAAGFEVIAPDLRGYGGSDLSPDDAYDLTIYSRDIEALVHDVLGHERCAVVAGDIGGVVAVDLAQRFDGLVERLCFFNSVPPPTPGFDLSTFSAIRGGPTGDYQELQGARPDELIAMLGTPEARRQWIAAMYTSRLWASPGTFTREQVDFMTEPFADEARLRASWAPYQLAHGRPMSEMPMTFGPIQIPTLVLYGHDDHVVGDDFVPACEVAFANRIGPLVVPGAGHFLQWERADILNPLLVATFGDLRQQH